MAGTQQSKNHKIHQLFLDTRWPFWGRWRKNYWTVPTSVYL